MGGRKNHDKVFPLCELHHTGDDGLHRLGRPRWEMIFGSEDYHLAKTARLLGE